MKYSVIIPAFNAKKTIIKTINSVLLSFSSDTEIIIIDDCSTDETYGVICDIISKENNKVKILYYKNERNIGVSASRNKGIVKSTGKYLLFVDADDVIEIGTKTYIDEIIHQNEGVEIIRFNHSRASDDELNIIGNKIEDIPVDLFKSYYFHSSCTQIVVRYLFEQVNYNEDLIFGEDMLLSFELLTKSNSFVLLSNKFYIYNEVESSVSNRINLEHSINCIDSICVVYDRLEELFSRNSEVKKILNIKKNKELSLQLLKVLKISEKHYENVIEKYRKEYISTKSLPKNFYNLHAFSVFRNYKILEKVLNFVYIQLKGKNNEKSNYLRNI
uniref:Glycosyltransferase family 2 protein n=1 Tax=Erysipelothrix tonsillarum TaxID=38402 RepID=A0A6S6I1T0_9FIRM|nr:glycosyltransferase family 2 protein [Erysipelothrix tonsillarum]